MRRLSLAAALAAALASSAFAQAGNPFIIANGAEPMTLDPSLIQGVPEHKVYLALFEGLVTNDPRTCSAAPGVAESWSVSPDGTQLTFTLRKSTWSDGVPITAQTVVDSWLRTLDPATGSEYAYLMTMVVKGAAGYNDGSSGPEAVQIRALDDSTFQVDLEGPMPYAVDMMAHYAFAILPMHAIQRYGKNWTKPKNMVCNGPFKLASWKPNESLRVVRNAAYWDAANVELESIVFLPIENQLTAYSYYKAGKVDWSCGIPLDLVDEIRERPDYQVSPQIATYYYIFNMTRKPFTDLRVRKALAMAIDREALIRDVTRGGQLPAEALVPPMDGYEPPAGMGYDPKAARRLLAEAGYPGGRGFPVVTILYNTNDNHRRIAEFVIASWKRELGIEVGLRNMEWKTFLDARSELHDFDVARAGWVGDYLDPNTFLDMFIQGSGNNDGLYKSKEYDALVRKAASMPQGKARMATLRAAETLLIAKDVAVIPFYHYVEQDLIDLSKWEGWYPNPLGIHPWKYLRPAQPAEGAGPVAVAP